MVVLDAHRLNHRDQSVTMFGRWMDGASSPWRQDRLAPTDLTPAPKWCSVLPHRLPTWLRLPCVYNPSDDTFSELEIGKLRCELAIALPRGRYAIYSFYYGDLNTPDGSLLRVAESIDEALADIPSGVLFADCQRLMSHVWKLRRELSADEMRFRIPCVCDPDAFVLHANLNVDSAGTPVFYRPPFVWLPDELACYRPEVMQIKALELATHRAAWIRSLQILEFAQVLCSITGISFAAALFPTSSEISDAMIEHTYVESEGTLALPMHDDSPVEFRGGLVLDLPLGAYHGNILVFDANSMYPSIVVEHHLDPLLARLFHQLIELRQKYDKASVRARALKLVANKLFGTRAHGRYANVRLAAEITRRGREVLQTAVDRTNATEGFQLLAGDTDSLIVLCDRDPQILLAELNRGWSFMRFKIDAHFMSLYMVTRKSYFAVQPNGAYYVRGLESVQSGVLPVIKRVHREWQRQLAGNQFACKELADKWVRDEAARLRAHPPESLQDQCSHPKPTREHQETDRARFCCEDKTFVSRAAVMECGAAPVEISIAHWIQLQLIDPLLRYNEVLF